MVRKHSVYFVLNLLLSCRTGNVEEHVSDPLKKNEFLSDLDQLEAGKIEEEVLMMIIAMCILIVTFVSSCRTWNVKSMTCRTM